MTTEYIEIDAMNKADWPKFFDCISGGPGKWQVEQYVRLWLHTIRFKGLRGHFYGFLGESLMVAPLTRRNGSSVVKDTPACLMASLFHDLACGAIRSMSASRFTKWCLRRDADLFYRKICIAQGMWGIRADIRFAGLRLGGPVYSLFKRDGRA